MSIRSGSHLGFLEAPAEVWFRSRTSRKYHFWKCGTAKAAIWSRSLSF